MMRENAEDRENRGFKSSSMPCALFRSQNSMREGDRPQTEASNLPPRACPS